MGLGIDKNHNYSNDRKIAGASTATSSATAPFAAPKIIKPILRFAKADNPNPTSAATSEPAEDPNPPSAATPEPTAAHETAETPVATTHVFKKWSELKAEYDRINKLPTNEARVVEFHKQNAGVNPKPYVVIDKAKCEATIYSADGEVLELFKVGIGKQKGDEIQLKDVEITEKDKKITIKHSNGPNKKSFETTSAGIYSVLGKAKVKGDYNEYSITTDRGSTGVSIHEIPGGHPELYTKIHDKDYRFSGGDVNVLPSRFKKMEKYVKPGTELYILPEDSNNKIVVRDGQLNLVQEHFTGTVSTSKNTVSHPIKIDILPPKPENLGILGTVSKWTWKLPKRAASGAVEWYYVDKSTKEKFAKALAEKKVELMDKLKIDNDTYNDLATLALGIGNQETKLGQSPKYAFKENWPWTTSKIKWVAGHTFWNVSKYDSRGMSQTKLDEYKDNAYVKGILDEYQDAEIDRYLKENGLTKDNIKNPGEFRINNNNLKDPEKAAIITMVVLASMYKNELPSLKAHMEKTHMTWQETMLYLWQGKKKSQVLTDEATPETNNYVSQAETFMKKRVALYEVVTAPKTVLEKPKK